MVIGSGRTQGCKRGYKKQKDNPDLYYYWGIALANTGEIKKALERWNAIGDMYNPRLKDYIARAKKMLANKREYSRFEYIAG